MNAQAKPTYAQTYKQMRFRNLRPNSAKPTRNATLNLATASRLLGSSRPKQVRSVALRGTA